MTVTSHILKSSGRLTPLTEQIEASIDEVVRSVEEKMELPDIDVVVADQPDAAIPEIGVGGHAGSAHVVYIYIDPEHKELSVTLDKEIKSSLTHEFHHAARMDKIGYGETLLEAMVSEGLADHFDLEINSGEIPPWSSALAAEQLAEVMDKARPEFNSLSYSHSDWFFGTDKDAIPRWAGYSLGFKLVEDHMKRTGKKASELVSTRAGEFVEQ
jgi:uncharacterized protein YjaZ